MIRTRFAPSPTGGLHLGNARIAVLNWLFARHHHGEFILRIEDTDVDRTVPGAEAGMLEDLAWLGLEWDEGPGVDGPAGEGPYGPYRQSERTAVYRAAAERLVREGRAFRCFCSPAELEAKRTAALARGDHPHYDGTCRRLADADVVRRLAEGRQPATRFHVADEGDVVVTDAVRGEIRFPAADIGDFILLRPDGAPTYNFAVVVDDAHMRISHVIRGVGHLSNTPRQLLLYDGLAHAAPVFAHVPTVLGPDRQKLSKRHGAQALAGYRKAGYHPDAIVNYLSLLSWSSPSGDEFLERARLINEISLDRIGVADVVFDPVKLRWLSAKHLDAMPLEELVDAAARHLDRERFPVPDELLPVAVAAVRTHLARFADINEHLDPFVPTIDAAGENAREAARRDPAAVAVLRAAFARLRSAEPWREETLRESLRAIGEVAGVRGRSLYEPLRIALTGHPHGPPLVPVLVVLGRASTLRLLGEVLESDTAGDPV